MTVLSLFFGICALACAFCAGYCLRAATARTDGCPPAPRDAPVRPLTGEEEREQRRHRREMQNFFQYNGDAMPVSGED